LWKFDMLRTRKEHVMTAGAAGNATDRIAIITGGSRGIGRNTAVNLARRGVEVIFTYRSNQVEANSLIRESDGKEGSGISP
jgi:NAD(P)-dependent dehydrogenase (short-subunit alcohol dehydrogenase family)